MLQLLTLSRTYQCTLSTFSVMVFAHGFLILMLLLPTMGRPFGLGLFEYDDDDDSTSGSEETTSDDSHASPATSSACKVIDDVLSYFGEVYEFLDKTFNPFHEEPPTTPLPPTTTLVPTSENTTTASPN